MLLAEGSYTGNATIRSITGVGINSGDLVIVWADNATTKVFRLSTAGFSGDKTSTFGSPTGTFAGSITSIDSDGFSLGTHATVNAVGVTYYYIVVKDDGNGDFAVGQFTGDAGTAKSISVGLATKYCSFKNLDGGYNAEMRIDTLASDESWTVDGTTFHADFIQSFTSTDIIVGTEAAVNASGDTICWFAFEYGATNTYAGNSTDDRNITGSGFDPTFMVLREEGFSRARAKIPDAIIGEKTLTFVGAALVATNEIQSLITDGFQVGDDTDVNTSGDDYHWFTTKTNPVAAGFQPAWAQNSTLTQGIPGVV